MWQEIPICFFLFFLINRLNFMAHNTKGNNLTVTVNHRLIMCFYVQLSFLFVLSVSWFLPMTLALLF